MYAVGKVGRFMEGKDAIQTARTFGGWARNFAARNFWVWGYFASPVGRDESVVRECICKQETKDERVEQPNLLLQPSSCGSSYAKTDSRG